MKSITKHIIISTICALVILSSAPIFAREIDFTISLSSESTQPGRQINLYIVIVGDADLPAINLPFTSGLDVKYRGVNRKPVEVDGTPTISTTFTYNIVPRTEGSYNIGPLRFEFGENTYISNGVVLNVSKSAATPLYDEVSGDIDISDRIYLEVDFPKKVFYVNEAIPVVSSFYSDWLDVEDVKVWDDPSENYVTEKYETGETVIIEKGAGRVVRVNFLKTIFAPEAGKFDFGPVISSFTVVKKTAQLLNPNEEFYNKFLGKAARKDMEIKVDPIQITVLPIPSKGRPTSFTGAVGSYNMNVDIDKTRVKPGELINIAVNITGGGNTNMLRPPIMPKADGLVFYDPKVEIKSDGIKMSQSIKVSSPDVKELPELIFSYFDPEKGEYITLKKGPIHLDIIKPEKPPLAAGEKKAALKEKEPVEVRPALIGIKGNPGRLRVVDPYFFKRWPFAALVLFPLFVLAAAIAVERRLYILRTDKAYAGWLRALKVSKEDVHQAQSYLKRGDISGFYGQVFRTLQNYFALRLDVPSGGISAQSLDSLLSADIVESDVITNIKHLFNDCYTARYTSGEHKKLGKEDMAAALKSTKEVISYLDGIRLLCKKRSKE